MEFHELSREALEDHSDVIKKIVVASLVAEGYLSLDEAQEWCVTHTVVGRRKTIFRELLGLWKKEQEIVGWTNWVVVSTVGAKKEKERNGTLGAV